MTQVDEYNIKTTAWTTHYAHHLRRTPVVHLSQCASKMRMFVRSGCVSPRASRGRNEGPILFGEGLVFDCMINSSQSECMGPQNLILLLALEREPLTCMGTEAQMEPWNMCTQISVDTRWSIEAEKVLRPRVVGRLHAFLPVRKTDEPSYLTTSTFWYVSIY